MTAMRLLRAAQLYAPLNYFGTQYRVIQQYMIDMENMFDLLHTHPALCDAPGAKEFKLRDGEIEVDNVHFNYGDIPVLRGVSFTVRAAPHNHAGRWEQGGAGSLFTGNTTQPWNERHLH
jgi:ABC-type transport system involved in Fe-S cluster assembly fused permease/ATPase subunit